LFEIALSPNFITLTVTKTFPWGKSWTQIIEVGDMICVADFYDLFPRLCRKLVADFVAKPA